MSSGLSLQFLVLLLLLLDIKNSLTVSLVGRWAVWSEREWERASDIDFMGISWTKEYCCCSSLPFCAVHNAMMTSLLLLVSRCASYTHKAKWGRDMRMVINRDLCLVVQWDQHQAMNFFLLLLALHRDDPWETFFCCCCWDVYEWKIDEVRMMVRRALFGRFYANFEDFLELFLKFELFFILLISDIRIFWVFS